MDSLRFDSLTRALAVRRTRRGILGGLAALAAGLATNGRATDAQAAQVQCGNKVCAANTSVCTNGCVCCVFANGNSRCTPPGTCTDVGTSPTTTSTAAPTTTPVPAPTTTTSTTSTTSIAAPAVCTLADPTCGSFFDVCSGTDCFCRPSTEGPTFCGPQFSCGPFGYCTSSFDYGPNLRCALSTCCVRPPGSLCCPATGGICSPLCGASAPPALGPDTSPPAAGER